MTNGNNNFELSVSIGNAAKAAIALRSYGLSESEAQEVITSESVIAIYDHGIVPQKALSPELIEVFGPQHITDALSYSYYYMEEFELDWDLYKFILATLLEVFRPEELITNPDYINYFIRKLKDDTSGKFIDEIINELSHDEIRGMATANPFEKEISDEDLEDEE